MLDRYTTGPRDEAIYPILQVGVKRAGVRQHTSEIEQPHIVVWRQAMCYNTAVF